MLVAIHQLHYLPWLRYVEKIARADVFIVLDNIQFNKNGWQNRNRVKTASGPLILTVPVFAKAKQRLDQVQINNNVNWTKKHWRTIEQAYRKAPYFSQYAPFLEDTYARQWTMLNDINRHMLEFFVQALNIHTSIVYASELNVPGTATERLVNLILAVGGQTYYSGAYALDAYLDPQALENAGINLLLQEWHAPVYPQSREPFNGDLSVLDLLMNCGPSSLGVLSRGGSTTAARGSHGGDRST